MEPDEVNEELLAAAAKHLESNPGQNFTWMLHDFAATAVAEREREIAERLKAMEVDAERRDAYTSAYWLPVRELYLELEAKKPEGEG